MNWTSDAAAGIKILASRHDTEDNSFAAGLSQCITKDGQSSPTADIGFNGKKILNLAAGVNPTDAVNKGQLDSKTSWSTGLTLSGAPSTGIGWTGTGADLWFGVKSGPIFAWNDKGDASGNDIMSLNKASQLYLISKDPGAAAGPFFYLYRDSATPAAGDYLGQVVFQGRDSTAEVVNYASVSALLDDPTNGSEDSSMYFMTTANGTQVNTLGLRPGASAFVGHLSLQGSGAGNASSGALYFHNGAGVSKGHLWWDGANNRLSLESTNNLMLSAAGNTLFLGSNFIYLSGGDATYRYKVTGANGTAVFCNTDTAAATTRFRVQFEGAGTSYGASWLTPATNGLTMVFSQQNTVIVGSIGINTTSTTYSTSSDIRTKSGIREPTDARALVDALQVVEYTPVDPGPALRAVEGTEPAPVTHMGIPAQQAYQVYPVAVTPPDTAMPEYNPEAGVGEEGFMPWMIDYSKFVPMLLSNVQELNARNDALEARITALETPAP